MTGMGFDPLADDGDGPSDGRAYNGGDGYARRPSPNVPEGGPRDGDDLDRRNRMVIIIDHAVSVAGCILCIGAVVLTAATLLSPLGL